MCVHNLPHLPHIALMSSGVKPRVQVNMEKPAACLLCGKSVLASNRRYLLVRVSSGVWQLTRLGEVLENASGRKVPAELPGREFVCNACRERVEKAERLRKELAESLDKATKRFQGEKWPTFHNPLVA